MQALQAVHIDLVHACNALNGGFSTGNRRDGIDTGCQSRCTDRPRIENGIAFFFNRIDDHDDFVIFDHVTDMRASFGNLVDGFGINASK